MAIFKGQGFTGKTGDVVQATMGKNKKNHSKNDGMTARNITENGRIADGDAQMGSCCPTYAPTAVKMPVYGGRPKQGGRNSGGNPCKPY